MFLRMMVNVEPPVCVMIDASQSGSALRNQVDLLALAVPYTFKLDPNKPHRPYTGTIPPL